MPGTRWLLFVLALIASPFLVFSQWSQVPIPSTSSFPSVVRASQNVLYASGPGLFKSNNGGSSWTSLDKQYSNYDPARFYLFDVYQEELTFLSETTGFSYGHNTNFTNEVIFRTTNGGTIWELVYDGLGGSINEIAFVDPSVGYAVSAAGRVLKTTNGGQSWTPLNTGTTRPLNDLWFQDQNNGIVVGENIILKTTNGGSTWTATNVPYHLRSVSFTDSNTGLAVGDAGIMLRTTDAGASWSPVSYDFIRYKHLNKIRFSGINGWLATQEGLYKTIDGGRFWTPQRTLENGNIGDFDFYNDQLGFLSSYFPDFPYYRFYTTSAGGDIVPRHESAPFDVTQYQNNLCRGVYPVSLRMINHAVDPLTTATVRWSVNDVEQPAFAWIGNLQPGDTSSVSTIGTYDFNKTARDFTVKVWTYFPNNAADQYTPNDTVIVTYRFNKPTGIYTIGGADPDFATIAEPVQLMKGYGICDDVVFNIRKGTYEGKLDLRNIQGPSSDVTITFQSESGIPQDVTLEKSTDFHVLEIESVPFVTIRGLRLVGTHNVVFVRGNLQSFLFENNVIESTTANNDNSTFHVNPFQGHLVLKNNSFTSADYGIYRRSFGIDNPINGSLTIENNTFSNQGKSAIHLEDIRVEIAVRKNRIFRSGTLAWYAGIELENCSVGKTVVANNFLQLTGDDAAGMYLQKGNYQVYYNTLYLKGSNNGIYLHDADSSVVMNNNIANYGTGSTLSITGDNNLQVDHNNLFSATRFFAAYSKTSRYASGETLAANDLNSWRAVSGHDLHSISIDPEAANDVHVSLLNKNYKLNGAGKHIPAILTDIDGQIRDIAAPDIGADEFSIPAVDAGILSVDLKSVMCEGTSTVKVQVKNFGTATISTYTVNWTADGQPQPAVLVNSALASRSSAYIDLGVANFPSGSHTIEAALTLSGDLVGRNDTISSTVKAGGLSGIYTVGGTNPDFPTLTAAVNKLKSDGVCADVVFNIRPGTYNEQLLIPKIQGASETSTITFQSEDQDSTTVTVSNVAAPVILKGAQWLNFRSMTLKTTEMAAGVGIIELTDGASHNTFAFNLLVSRAYSRAVIFSPPNTAEEFNRVANNRFSYTSGAATAIHFEGPWTYSPQFTQFERGNVITNNVFEATTEHNPYGLVELISQNGFIFSGNTAEGIAGDGLILNRCLNFTVTSNKIISRTEAPQYGFGISIEFSQNRGIDHALLANNFIRAEGNGTALVTRFVDNIRILNNTIVSSGAGTSLRLGSSGDEDQYFDNIELKNNIMIANGEGHCAIFNPHANIVSDYNVYYARHNHPIASNFTNMWGIEGQTFEYASLYQWQQASGKDAHSRFFKPRFVSASDLHVLNDSRIKGAGTPVGLTVDIDGDPRNAMAPDIGADEFEFIQAANDAGIARAVRPDECGPNQSVKAVVRNYGSNTLTSATIEWSVNAGLMPAYQWTGSLAPGEESGEIVLGDAFFNPSDSSAIAVWTSLANGVPDPESVNDTSVVDRIYQKLNGDYTIGHNSMEADFPSIKQATEYLKRVGVCGPVTFQFLPGIYEDDFVLWEVTGASEVNRITFQGDATDSSAVVIRVETVGMHSQYYDPDVGYYVVLLDGADHFTFRDLTVEASWPGAAFRLYNNCSDNEFIHTTIRSGPTQGYVLFDFAKGTADDTFISNNSFIGGDYGINSTAILNNTVIESNTFEEQGTAINLASLHRDTRISKNRAYCSALNSQTSNGFLVANARGNFVMDNNIISGSFQTGLQIQDCGSRTSSGLVYNNMIAGNQDLLLGISSGSNRNIRFIFNSVNLTSPTPGYYAFGSAGDSALVVQNNNFIHRAEGMGLMIERLNKASSIVDFNNIWSAGNQVWYDGLLYNMEDYQLSSGLDAHSISVDPIYISETNLHALNPALNGTGIHIDGITADIDGELRDPTPDIGADEIVIYPADAGVVSVLADETCLGSNEVRVTIQNLGASLLGKATIEWMLNGVQQPPFTWVGKLLTGEVSQPFVIGTCELMYLGEYEITARTSFPNDLEDPNVVNDASTIAGIRPGASGTYTIGGVSPDFPTISAAVEMLKLQGICSAVTFHIRDGVYYEQIEVPAIKGASEANRITFKSEGQDAGRVSITYAATEGSNNFVVRLNGASYITFDHLTVEATGQTYSNCISMFGVMHAVRITNNKFISPQNATYNTSGNKILLGSDAGLYGSSISYNEFRGGGTGVSLAGAYNDRYSDAIPDTVIGNTFVNQFQASVSGSWVNGHVIRNNTIHQDSPMSITYAGIQFSDSYNLLIRENRIATYSAGIVLRWETKNCLVANNFISIKDGFTSSAAAGIRLIQSGQAKIFHNSIHIADTDNISTALWLEYNTVFREKPVEVKNNILSNEGGGLSMYVYNQPATSDILLSDYNDHFTTGSTLFRLNSNGANSDYSSLTAWKTATNQDKNSIVINPQFVSFTDLHAQAPALTGAGTSVSVQTDIDGQLRHLSYPTIGADEFGTVRRYDLASNGQVTQYCDANQPLGMIVKNTGVETITSFTIQWSLNGVTQPSRTWTGSVAPRSEVTYYFARSWFPGSGIQNMNVTIVNPNSKPDETSDDNTFSANFTLHAPVNLGMDIAACQGSNVLLNAGDGYVAYAWADGVTGKQRNVSSSGQYTITVTDLNGCTSTDAIRVDFLEINAEIKAVAGDRIICEGETIALEAFNEVGYSYQWLLNGSPITNATTSSYTASTGGIYQVKTSAASCSATSPGLSITVSTKPEKPAVTVDGEKSLCDGATAVLTASDGYTSYVWSNGATTKTIDASVTGDYSVTTYNADGCASDPSESISVVVNPSPVASITLHDGNKLTASSGQSYEWYFNDALLPSETSQTLTIHESGLYRVKVTDSNNCSAISDAYEFNITGLEALVSGRIYPNPATRYVYVHLSVPGKDVDVLVTDAAGRRVHNTVVANSREDITIDMGDVPAGIYFLELHRGETVEIRKIMMVK